VYPFDFYPYGLICECFTDDTVSDKIIFGATTVLVKGSGVHMHKSGASGYSCASLEDLQAFRDWFSKCDFSILSHYFIVSELADCTAMSRHVLNFRADLMPAFHKNAV
jgi:hypothetical protein